MFTGLYELIHDNTTESKRTINILQRMNIYQEVFLSILYRILPIQVFNHFCFLSKMYRCSWVFTESAYFFFPPTCVYVCGCLFCRPTWSQFISTSTQFLLCRQCMSSLSLSLAGYSVTHGWLEPSVESGTSLTGMCALNKITISLSYTQNSPLQFIWCE